MGTRDPHDDTLTERRGDNRPAYPTIHSIAGNTAQISPQPFTLRIRHITLHLPALGSDERSHSVTPPPHRPAALPPTEGDGNHDSTHTAERARRPSLRRVRLDHGLPARRPAVPGARARHRRTPAG